MNTTSDATAAGNGGTFDPQQAAALLDHTTQQARRQLQPSPPWLLATRGVLVLAALGGIWLSVRTQHPYRGPTAADIPILIGFIVLNFTATVTVRSRATAGVAGPSRLRPAEVIVTALSWVATVALVAGLLAAGVSYGKYPAMVLILPGLAWAAVSVARTSWRNCAVGLGVALTGAAGLLAGPGASWAITGAGLCAVLLANAAAIIWQQRQHG